jgi:hypothetical protein
MTPNSYVGFDPPSYNLDHGPILHRTLEGLEPALAKEISLERAFSWTPFIKMLSKEMGLRSQALGPGP